MTTEFNLSDEIFETNKELFNEDLLRVPKVKEFIKRLKEEMHKELSNLYEERFSLKINKLAGKKLI